MWVFVRVKQKKRKKRTATHTHPPTHAALLQFPPPERSRAYMSSAANANRLPHPDEIPVPRFSHSGTQIINAYLDGLVDSKEINSKGQLSFKENCPTTTTTTTDTPYGRQTMEPRFPLADLVASTPGKPLCAPRVLPSPGVDVTQRVLAPEIRSLEKEHEIKDAVIAQLVRDHQDARDQNRALREKVVYLERLVHLLTNVVDSFCALFHVRNPTEVA